MVLIWAIGGLFAGMGLAFLLHQLDNTFRGSEDVERRLGLPVLGQLPQLKVDKEEKLAPMHHFVKLPRSASAGSLGSGDRPTSTASTGSWSPRGPCWR